MRIRLAAAAAFVSASLAAPNGSALAGEKDGAVLRPDPSRAAPAPIGFPAAPYTIASKALGEERRLLIATPPSFAATARAYPVILVLDGEVRFPSAVSSIAFLAEAGHVPEAIVVGIENTERERDFTPPGLEVPGMAGMDGGDRFLDFVEKELLPELARGFRASGLSILVGHSHGGVIAAYAAATRGAAFPFVLALDTPMHLDSEWLPGRLAAAAREKPSPPRRLVFLEARFGWRDAAWDAFREAAPGSWRLHREKVAKESHETMAHVGLYLGLRQLFEDYSMNGAGDETPGAALDRYERLMPLLGGAPPPQRFLLRAAGELADLSDAARARRTLELLDSSYGDGAAPAALRVRVEGAEKRPPPAETVESLLAIPFPSPVEMRPFLGTWVGETWAEGEERRNSFTLVLREAGGAVEGEVVMKPAPGTDLRMAVQCLTLVEGGLHFGYRNGMNPRGILMYEGALDGDGVLSGRMRLRGIEFKWPEGMTPPRIRFAIRRDA